MGMCVGYCQGATGLDNGPLRIDDGSLSYDNGPLRIDDGSLSYDNGPLRIDVGSSSYDDGPLRIDDGLLSASMARATWMLPCRFEGNSSDAFTASAASCVVR